MTYLLNKIVSYIYNGVNNPRADALSLHKQYIDGGRVPWTKGYSKYRNSIINKVISSPAELMCFSKGSQLPAGYGFKLDERCIEIPWIKSRFPSDARSFLDAGCAYLKFEAIRQHLDPAIITAILTLDERDMAFNVPGIDLIRIKADMRSIPTQDQKFDTITCVSTLEHVGMDNTQLYTSDASFCESNKEDYLQAFKALVHQLTVGGSLFITVPYGVNVNHGWLQVFNAEMLNKLIGSPEVELIEEEIYQHEKSGWVLSNREKSMSATYYDVHHNAGHQYTTALAAAEAVACLWFKRI